MSDSIPCRKAYDIHVAAIYFSIMAIILGISSFITYVVKVNKHQNIKFKQTQYDIESASLVLILTIIAAMINSNVYIINSNCGEKCTAEMIDCNNQIGIAVTALITALGIVIGASMKILSLYYQIKHPNKNYVSMENEK